MTPSRLESLRPLPASCGAELGPTAELLSAQLLSPFTAPHLCLIAPSAVRSPTIRVRADDPSRPKSLSKRTKRSALCFVAAKTSRERRRQGHPA